MKVLGLISGGKDSIFNCMQCIAHGHDLVALGHLSPQKEELDSYMYQSVGHRAIPFVAECLGLPLFQQEIQGTSMNIDMDYCASEQDEVEDLFRLLSDIKTNHIRDLEAVSVGAICSNYQRIRVEHVASRLGLVVLGYLWGANQQRLLECMIQHQVHAILIKTAVIGLHGAHIGKELSELLPHFLTLQQKWGMNVAGEGGEYESLVLDCPLYKKKLVIEQYETVVHSDRPDSPVVYMIPLKMKTIEKSNQDFLADWQSSLKQTSLVVPS